jgi:hypothetical protein
MDMDISQRVQAMQAMVESILRTFARHPGSLMHREQTRRLSLSQAQRVVSAAISSLNSHGTRAYAISLLSTVHCQPDEVRRGSFLHASKKLSGHGNLTRRFFQIAKSRWSHVLSPRRNWVSMMSCTKRLRGRQTESYTTVRLPSFKQSLLYAHA